MAVTRPNIVYILADDLGYGDVACNDADCLIPTPNLDGLAARGVRCTDAHATSAICTPSRYSILTGRYAWRSRLKQGIVWHWDAPLIEDGQPTVARFLSDQGYRTACVGKWHLGWDWATTDGAHPNDTLPFGEYCDAERAEYETNIDYTKPVSGGPVDRGFDTYFGVDVPNFPPYAWFENDSVTEAPTEPKPDEVYGHMGQAVPGWNPHDIVPECTRRATEFIHDAAAGDAPFFLYFALTSPHSPVVPNEAFVGHSGIGAYGDFVCEVDWIVGEVVAALEEAGCTDDTLVIFTSDNGPELEMGDDEGAFKRAERTRHFSMGELRGIKRDVWEGGHRVPFIASWPGQIPAGTTADALVSLSDFFATCAEIVGAHPDHGDADAAAGLVDSLDSDSMLGVLRGTAAGRNSLVLHGGGGRFALRQGRWLYVDAPSGGEWPEPEWFRSERGYTNHDHPAELFDLHTDLAERHNRYNDEPELAQQLSLTLDALVEHNRVAPPSDDPVTE